MPADFRATATLPQTACQKALRPHEFSRNPNPAQTKAPSDLRVCAASVADREPGSKISDKQVQGCRAFGAFGFSGFGFKHSGVDRVALGSNGYFTWNREIWIWSRPALVDSVLLQHRNWGISKERFRGRFGPVMSSSQQ